jgi:putative ABC transport system ATP-binding protein
VETRSVTRDGDDYADGHARGLRRHRCNTYDSPGPGHSDDRHGSPDRNDGNGRRYAHHSGGSGNGGANGGGTGNSGTAGSSTGSNTTRPGPRQRRRLMKEILSMQDIVKCYYVGETGQTVLDHVNLQVREGEFVSVLGPSGSGKSTLMNIIGCLDVATSGRYILDGQNVEELDERELARIRNREIGFVFQSFQLLPRLNALENVELPMIYSQIPPSEREKKAAAILERVGLEDKLKSYPNQLSGGQQQRVAIARSVVTEPAILLADEPTGALDQKSGLQIMSLFEELNSEGRTIIMITHDINIAKHAGRIVNILDGRLSEGELS